MTVLRMLLAAAVVNVAARAEAADWPQYKRDAARTGDAAEEVLAFPMSRIVAVRFPSPIYASPAVVGGRVYIQDARGHVGCIDAADNRPLWVTPIGGVANYSSPAVAGGKVFVGSSAGHLAVLDAATGELLKKVPAEGGVISAPAVANDGVYFCSFNGELFKVDFSGNVVWKTRVGRAFNQELAVHGREIVLLSGPFSEERKAEPLAMLLLEDKGASVELKARLKREEWARLDAKDPKWRGLRFFGHGNILTTPVVGLSARNERTFWRGLDILVCPSGEKGYLWYAGGWPDYEGGPPGHMSQPALSREHVVVGGDDGRVYFFAIVQPQEGKVAQGKRAAWVYRAAAESGPNRGIVSSPALADGKVFFGGEDGILYGLGKGEEAEVVPAVKEGPRAPEAPPGGKLKGREWVTGGGDMGYSMVSPEAGLKPPFRIRWKTKIAGTGSQGAPVVADGKVFIASYNGRLEALDADTGEIIWRTYHYLIQHSTGYGNDGPPTYAEGKVLVLRTGAAAVKTAAANTGLWCHDARTGEVLWRDPRPVLFPPGGAPMGDGVVAAGGKAFAAWHKEKDVLEAAAFDLGTGKEVWRQQYPGVLPPEGAGSVRVCQGTLGEGAWFFSACRFPKPFLAGADFDRAAGHGGATLAVDPASGRLLWKNDRKFVNTFGGMNCRGGVLMVYESAKASHALAAGTGQPLWSVNWGPQHLQPLTDAFLDSKGERGRMGGYCSDRVVAGEYSFGPYGHSASVFCVRDATGKEVWRYLPLSRGCPTPAIAYGRLYYVPFGEGVAYCFENAEPESVSRERAVPGP